MTLLIRIGAPIAGDHGCHPADSIVTFPVPIAQQIVANGHGVVVNSRGDQIPHDFDNPLILTDLTSAELTEEITSILAPVTPKGRARKKSEVESKTEVETKPATDLAEWDTEE